MAMNEPSKNDNLIDYALRYAEIGWHVFPLHWIVGGKCSCGNDDCGKNSGKHPFSKLAPQGQKNATTDKSVIKRWWSDYPLCNIGVFLFPSGLAAVDVDPRNGGYFTLEGIEAKHGALPHSVMQFTGGGGVHYLYKVGGKTVLPGTLGKGIDLKRNGYIVVEPSSHISGGAYAWEGSSSPLDGSVPDDFPEWLLPSEKIDDDDGDECNIQTISDLRAALNYLIPSADDYQFWVEIGMMLSTVKPSDAGLGLWIDWSKNSDKYTRQKCIEKWKTFKPSDLTYKSVFYRASQKGWINPGYPIDEVVPGDDEGWRQGLISSPGKKAKILSRLHNAVLFLTHLNEYKGRFRFNAFSHLDEIDGRPMADEDDSAITCELEKHFDEKISTLMVRQAISLVARELPYNPLTDYLNSCSWDGVGRVATLFVDYFGSDDTDYCRDVARSFMVSAVARAFEPGCKVDTMTILEGGQGLKKSTFIRRLVGNEWYAPMGTKIGDKDSFMALANKWVLDFGDLAGLSKHDANIVKAFLDHEIDYYRSVYGKRFGTVKRSCIFFGSTNEDKYLTDITGNRRFLPVRCPNTGNIDKLLLERNQLWAEALHLYRSGWKWWEIRNAEQEQSDRLEQDDWQEDVLRYAESALQPENITTRNLAVNALGFDIDKVNSTVSRRIGGILKANGYKHKKIRGKDGKPVWIFQK